MEYVELDIFSNLTFLEAGSHAEELAATAAAMSHPAIAVTDRNTPAGIARAHAACETTGVRPVVGARLNFTVAGSVLFYPQDRATNAQLSELLTVGRRRAAKGQCELSDTVYGETDSNFISLGGPHSNDEALKVAQ